MTKSIIAGSILSRAAARIERDGWHQGSYFPKRTPDEAQTWRDVHEKLNLEPRPCCAIGALMAEATSAPDYREAEGALVEGAGFAASYCIPDWNDNPARTKEEVVDTLYAAAEWCGWTGNRP